jgi:hypothetical protein
LLDLVAALLDLVAALLDLVAALLDLVAALLVQSGGRKAVTDRQLGRAVAATHRHSPVTACVCCTPRPPCACVCRSRQAAVLARKRREYLDMIPQLYDIDNGLRSEEEVGALRQVRCGVVCADAGGCVHDTTACHV